MEKLGKYYLIQAIMVSITSDKSCGFIDRPIRGYRKNFIYEIFSLRKHNISLNLR